MSDSQEEEQQTSSAMNKRQLLLISSSRVHGFKYLEHVYEHLIRLLGNNNVKKVLFIPYALKDHDGYTATVSEPLNKWGYQVEPIHKAPNPVEAVLNAQAIFVGGGNTFILLKTLYDMDLITPIREAVLTNGVPYIGSSAGTNVATRSIHTTNDMPICHPPSLEALKLIDFNINPHYLDPDPDSQHKGETRDQRIREYIQYTKRPVLGLREGASLLVKGNKALLIGVKNGLLFQPDLKQTELAPNTDLSFLL